MGAAQSENILRNTINEIMSVVNDNSQSCTVSGVQLQSISFQNVTTSGGQGIVIKNLDWSQMASINSKCMQSSEFTGSLSSSISQKLQQVASSVVKNYGIGYASAKNVVDLMTNISLSISNKVIQTIIVTQAQGQNISFVGVTTTGIEISFLNWKQAQDIIAESVQTAIDNSNIVSNLQQIVSQSATATVTGINWGLIIIVIAICVTVVLTSGVVVTGKGFLNWKVMMGLCVMIVVVVLVIYFIHQNKVKEQQRAVNAQDAKEHSLGIKNCTSIDLSQCPEGNGDGPNDYECFLDKWCRKKVVCTDDYHGAGGVTRNGLKTCVDYNQPDPYSCYPVPFNYICDTGRFSAPNVCGADSECPSPPTGHVCTNGVCSAPLSCTNDDSECGDIKYVCHKIHPSDPQGACKYYQCKTDSDCGITKNKCDTNKGVCVDPSAPTTVV